MRNLRVLGAIGLALALAACGGGGGGGGKKSKKNPAQSAVPMAPGAVPGLRADPADAQVKLTWSVPVDGGIPAAIKVYRAAGTTPPAAAGSPFATVLATQLEYTDSTVSNYQSYSYVVVAANDVGDGPPSDPVAATPRAGLPGAPTGLAARNGDGQVTLTWSAPASGGPATQYRVYRGQTASLDATWATISTVNVSVSTIQDADLTNFTAYGYLVRAVNPTGEGPPSTVALGYPNNGVPGIPQGVAATAGNQRVQVSWSAPNDGGDPKQYTVYRGAALPFDVETWLAFSPRDAPTTTLDDTSAVNWVTYGYVVMASNPIGSGPASNAGIAMPNNGAPGTPQNVLAIAGDRTVLVTWDAPLAGAGDVFEYAVSRCEMPACATWSTVGEPVSGASPLLQLTDIDVANFATYRYRVAASNPIDTGANSAEVAAMPNNGVPGTPQSLAHSSGDHQVTLTWQAPQGGGDVYEYRVYRSPNPNAGASGTLVVTLQPNELSYLDNPANPLLDNYALYYYAVAAWNPAGQGALSDSPAVMPGLLPGAPLALGATPGNHAVALAWNAPTSGGDGRVDSYSVYRSDPPTWSAFTGPLNLTPIPATQTTFTDATAGNYQSYYYRVVATNPKGTSAPSNEVFAYPRDYSVPIVSDPPPDLTGGDQVGRSVAVRGDYALVGAPRADNGIADVGAVYVYRRQEDGTWKPADTLRKVPTVTDPLIAEQYGHSVAISGNVVLVGAPLATWPIAATPNPQAGRVYVYRRQTDGSWLHEKDFQSNTQNGASDQFGYAVAADGNTAMVGARLDNRDPLLGLDNQCGLQRGAVYFFDISPGSSSSQVARFEPFTTLCLENGVQKLNTANFGRSIGLSGDLAIVGAPRELDNQSQPIGAVYFYRRTNGIWQSLSSDKRTTATRSTSLGIAVAIQGTLAAAGAPGEDCPGAVSGCTSGRVTGAGAVHLYRWNGTAWADLAVLRAPTAIASENFGQTIALDGNSVIVGAGTLTAPSTTRRVYRCTGSGVAWSCQTTPLLQEANNLAASGVIPETFDTTYGLAIDGPTIVVGRPSADRAGQSATDDAGDVDFY